MNKTVNINLIYNNDGSPILKIIEQDFKDFLNDYIKEHIK